SQEAADEPVGSRRGELSFQQVAAEDWSATHYSACSCAPRTADRSAIVRHLGSGTRRGCPLLAGGWLRAPDETDDDASCSAWRDAVLDREALWHDGGVDQGD